jgi:hypothetical protein
MKSSVVSRAWLESELLAQGLHPCDITDERLAEFKLPPPDRFSRLLTPEDAKWRNVRWKFLRLAMRVYRNVSCGDIDKEAGYLLRGVAIALGLREQFGRLAPGERLSKRMEYESVAFELWTRRRLQPQRARWLHDLEHKTLAKSDAPYASAIVAARDPMRLGIVSLDADLHAARIAEAWHRTQVGTARAAELRLRDERGGGRKYDESLRVDLDERLLYGYYVALGQATRLSFFDGDGRIRASAERWKSAFDRLDGNAQNTRLRRERKAKKAEAPEAKAQALLSGGESQSRRHPRLLLASGEGAPLECIADSPDACAADAVDFYRATVKELTAMLASANQSERAFIQATIKNPDAKVCEIAAEAQLSERAIQSARDGVFGRLRRKFRN